MCRVFHGTLHSVMWRYFLSYYQTLKITNMSENLEHAKKQAYILDGYMSDLRLHSIENAHGAGFERGYKLCQKEYEEKLRWIPVEEKLPEIGERVLLKNEFYEYVGFLSKNKKDFRALTVEISYSNEKIKGVTHWRYFL